MDNNELLAQIVAITNDLRAELKSDISQVKMDVAEMMEDQTRDIKLMIENDVTKRIDALFDGYKLSHEKQWELERKMEAMERRLERLEAMAG